MADLGAAMTPQVAGGSHTQQLAGLLLPRGGVPILAGRHPGQGYEMAPAKGRACALKFV